MYHQLSITNFGYFLCKGAGEKLQGVYKAHLIKQIRGRLSIGPRPEWAASSPLKKQIMGRWERRLKARGLLFVYYIVWFLRKLLYFMDFSKIWFDLHICCMIFMAFQWFCNYKWFIHPCASQQTQPARQTSPSSLPCPSRYCQVPKHSPSPPMILSCSNHYSKPLKISTTQEP